MDADQGIKNLIERAELCLERGQRKMAANAVKQAFERMEEIEVDDETYNRALAVEEEIGEAPAEASQEADTKCDKCHGTGNYGRGRKCYACVGKGYQTAEDRTRNKNYWAFRESERIQRKAAYANSPLF